MRGCVGQAWVGWSNDWFCTDACVLGGWEDKGKAAVMEPYNGALDGQGVSCQQTMGVLNYDLVQFTWSLLEGQVQ